MHVTFGDAKLEPMPAGDPSHSGVFTSRFATVFESFDGAFQVGFEELTGDITAAPAEELEEIIVVLAGTAEIECSGETYHLEPGDVVAYDHPIGSKRLRTSGLKTAYVIRHRR